MHAKKNSVVAYQEQISNYLLFFKKWFWSYLPPNLFLLVTLNPFRARFQQSTLFEDVCISILQILRPNGFLNAIFLQLKCNLTKFSLHDWLILKINIFFVKPEWLYFLHWLPTSSYLDLLKCKYMYWYTITVDN